MCLEEKDLYAYGDKFSSKYSRPIISLKIPEQECRNGTYDFECKTSYDYEKSIENKALIIIQNQMRFDREHYGRTSPIEKISKIIWYQVPTISVKV